MAEPFLCVQDLTIRFATASQPVIDRASFEISHGETVALVGPSGEGKTTLGRALIGLLAPGAVLTGSIRFDGCELVGATEKQWSRFRGSKVAMIIQEPELALNPVLRIRRQVAEVLRSHVRLDRRKRLRHVSAMLESVGLSERRIHSAYPNQLSGGQRQRVVIAQALIAEPVLLIADEPTSALDTVAQWEVIDLLRFLKSSRNLALLFITHRHDLLAGLADRILTLQSGKLVEGLPSGSRRPSTFGAEA